MTTRKTALLSVTAFLLLVCIIQGITGAINPVKIIKTSAEPDAITISKDGNNIEIVKKIDGWYVGKNDYLANKSEVERMIKEIQEIKVLDKIGRLGSSDNDEKYSLTEGKATIVRAYKGGKELQTLMLGKTSSTNSQTYGSVAGKKDILLLSGNLTSVFGKAEEDLRTKTVFAVEENEITGASVTMGAKSWTLNKISKKGGESEWSISGIPEFPVNADEAKRWIQNVAFMNISSWIDDSTALPANKLTSFQLITKGDPVNVDIYEQKAGDKTKYIGTCSRTVHKFELTKAQTEKFTKDPESLKLTQE